MEPHLARDAESSILPVVFSRIRPFSQRFKHGGSQVPLRNRDSSIFVGSVGIPSELKELIDPFVDQLEEEIERIAKRQNIMRAVVRSRLTCNTLIYVNATCLYIVAEPSGTIASIRYLQMVDQPTTLADAVRDGRWQHGLKDTFALSFDRSILDKAPSDQSRVEMIRMRAASHVQGEVQRMLTETQMMVIEPLFGKPVHLVNDKLCFVLMPFNQELTDVFDTVVKPTIERHGLVARRADDIRGIQPIMSDIWKSICEARIVLADLTGRNPNVFYELGIAHTVGKKTILISQQEETSIPFDVSHIRQIRYRDNARGLETLKTELDATIEQLLLPNVVT